MYKKTEEEIINRSVDKIHSVVLKSGISLNKENLKKNISKTVIEIGEMYYNARKKEEDL